MSPHSPSLPAGDTYYTAQGGQADRRPPSAQHRARPVTEKKTSSRSVFAGKGSALSRRSPGPYHTTGASIHVSLWDHPHHSGSSRTGKSSDHPITEKLKQQQQHRLNRPSLRVKNAQESSSPHGRRRPARFVKNWDISGRPCRLYNEFPPSVQKSHVAFPTRILHLPDKERFFLPFPPPDCVNCLRERGKGTAAPQSECGAANQN